jgi:hypothetical protein
VSAGEAGGKAIIAALLANLGIALSKFVAFLITRSASMLAESVHSVADTGNQALLLVGRSRAARPADEEHPFGYGKERFFWVLLAAVLTFVAGGVFGILEGVKKAGSTDTDAVIAAMEQMKYDAYKGEEYFRKCDHQAVQSVLVIESKPEAKMKGKFDIFDVVHTEPADEKVLRTCQELGYKA